LTPTDKQPSFLPPITKQQHLKDQEIVSQTVTEPTVVKKQSALKITSHPLTHSSNHTSSNLQTGFIGKKLDKSIETTQYTFMNKTPAPDLKFSVTH
jgi:hypothetical protein